MQIAGPGWIPLTAALLSDGAHAQVESFWSLIAACSGP